MNILNIEPVFITVADFAFYSNMNDRQFLILISISIISHNTLMLKYVKIVSDFYMKCRKVSSSFWNINFGMYLGSLWVGLVLTKNI